MRRRYLFPYHLRNSATCLSHLFLSFVAIISCTYLGLSISEEPKNGIDGQLPPPSSLGVHHVQLFARAPVLGQEKVVALNIWLKCISPATDGGGQGAASSHLLPTQTAAVEGFAWADDLGNLTNNKFGKYMTTVDVQAWSPQLRLQVWGGDDVVLATPHPALHSPGGDPLKHPWSHLRAFFFSFRLDTQPHARCFKLYEESFPDIRAPFCTPVSSVGLCSQLAPDLSFTPSQPALWTVMVPFRSWGMSGSFWDRESERVANRLQHYAAYLRGMGGTGLLLYADRFTMQGLERYPAVRQMLLDGTLVIVDWERIERLKYNSDQALVYSHAFLGLSSCGANLWLQIADVDELLYSPYRRPWPAMFNCLIRSTGSSAAGLIRLGRVDVIVADGDTEREAALWYSAPDAAGQHPLAHYGKISRFPHPQNVGKYIACPARRIVAVWMHTALPLHGSWHEGNASCAFFLHLSNYWVHRASDDAGMFDRFRLG